MCIRDSNCDYEIARDVDHNAVFRSNTAGSYQVSLSDGTTKDVTIDKSGEVLDLSDAKWNLTIDSYGPKYKDASSKMCIRDSTNSNHHKTRIKITIIIHINSNQIFL